MYGRLRFVNLMSDTVRGHIFGVFVGSKNQDTHDFPG